MRKTIIVFAVVLIAPLFARDSNLPGKLAAGAYRVGVFEPLTYAWSDSVQLETHPLVFWVLPNARVHCQQRPLGGLNWASVHGFVWPTPLLRLLAREGTGGFISPEFEVPQMVSFYNGIESTILLTPATQIQWQAGVSFALRRQKPNPGSSIDLPWVYPRLQVFYSGYLFTLGAAIRQQWTPRWSGCFSLKALIADDSAIENRGTISWTSAGGTEYRLGYWLSYARYPFGRQAHLIVPVFDVVWTFGANSKD